MIGLFAVHSFAHNFVGAWWIDSAVAVDALEAQGFTVFHVSANLSGGCPTTISPAVAQVLSAIDGDHHAIIDLSCFTAPAPGAASSVDLAKLSAAMIAVQNLERQYGTRILGYLTFDEPNLGPNDRVVPKEVLQSWYANLKTVAPSKWVFVDFGITDCGLPRAEVSIDRGGGLSYDSAMLNFYPYRYEWSDEQAEQILNAAASHAAAYFDASTWVWPINQAAYRSSEYCSENANTELACYYFEECRCGIEVPGIPLCTQYPPSPPLERLFTVPRVPNGRVQYDLSRQYEIWFGYGLMGQSHALFYYSWGTDSYDDRSLKNDSMLLGQAGIMAREHQRRLP